MRPELESDMAQQATGPTWTRILTIVLYLFFASLPALSFAVFYSCLWLTGFVIVFLYSSSSGFCPGLEPGIFGIERFKIPI